MAQDDIHKHLEFIQDVITRMSRNCTLLKGWTLTLVVAIFVLGVKEGQPLVAWSALVPLIVFWLLDASYLRLERLYRRLYDAARSAGDDGLRDTTGHPYPMSTKPYESMEKGVIRIAFSWSVGWFYAAIAVVLLILLLALAFRAGP